MSEGPDPGTNTLAAAERVAEVLARLGIDSALIGALALAAHGYPRSTDDLDLAIGVEPRRLEEIARELRGEGFGVDVHPPDAADPLGGVVRVRAEGIDTIEIVNFNNPPAGGFPALVEIAMQDVEPCPGRGRLRVVSLPHLVLFKLYAGGPKSKSDVLELLSRNPGADLNQIRELAGRFRMDRRLDAWLRELASPADE